MSLVISRNGETFEKKLKVNLFEISTYHEILSNEETHWFSLKFLARNTFEHVLRAPPSNIGEIFPHGAFN